MTFQFPRKDRYQLYETPESWMQERMKLDDRIDYYKLKLVREKHELETTRGFIARLRLKKQIRETEDILQHLEEAARHWFRDIEYYIPR